MPMTRREAIKAAAALGASLAWGGACTAVRQWRERRDLYPQGVASADPHPDSVLLWTRRPDARRLMVEVAEDASFTRGVATAEAALSADTDWTCRVLVAGLAPSRVYWYRFVDEQGFGSRIGRTLTAPAEDDGAPVRFAYGSCQNIIEGACNAYRRLMWEDERKAPEEQLQFFLHLGDYVYEMVNYPEDRPNGRRYDRRLRDVVRYPGGEKIRDFHIPTNLEDYRVLYRGYLSDPDLQDARARWPFVCVWDNHEFSYLGWQSTQTFDGVLRFAQTRRVAANQAWFEYQPARVLVNGKAHAERFDAPAVRDTPIREFDEDGLGLEPNNLAAIRTLTIYRALRFGRNLELVLTDNHSYRAYSAMDGPDAAAYVEVKGVPYFSPMDVVEALDAGRPETIRFDGKDVPNPRKGARPPMMLGAKQKAWFFDRLRSSRARWKLWGNSQGMLDWRTDCQNLPPETGVQWPTTGYSALTGDWTAYRTARNEILDFVRREGIAGFGTVAGDRHSFIAGLLSRDVPPRAFEPVGVEFITGSISAPGLAEAAEYGIPKDHPLRALYVYDPKDGGAPQCAVNVSLMHGVRASLALQRTGDARDALAARNPDVAPHLSFVDVGGHGYTHVRLTADEMEVEFVCIPRPLERSETDDGGPLRYRVQHRVKMWKAGETPHVERRTLEGTPPIGV